MSDKTERLVNLTVALLEARRPLTFADLRRRTGYYDQADRESARRMFERDKDDLRSLGVPIEVRDDPYGDEPGYLVDRRAYELPDVDLDPAEVAALALALEVTGAPEASLALAKVAARAPDPSSLSVRPTARVAVPTDPLDAVADAVVGRLALRFTYRAADGRTSERTVDPYAVVRRRRAWYVVGRDHDRDDLRAFRLDRVVDGFAPIGEPAAFTPPDDLDAAAMVVGPESGPVVTTVAAMVDSRWSVVARGGVDTGERIDDRSVLRVDDLDPVRDRAWLLGLAPEAVVLGPQDLRAELVAALDRTIELHAPDAEVVGR
jgi:proteasome accessory factor B